MAPLYPLYNPCITLTEVHCQAPAATESTAAEPTAAEAPASLAEATEEGWEIFFFFSGLGAWGIGFRV